MISRRRVELCLLVSILVLASVLGPQARGATLVRVGFDDMVSGAEVIVRVTVVEKSCFERSMGSSGAARDAARDEVGRVPTSALPDAAPSQPVPPLGLGTEGGRMIFTQVVLEVDETLKGTADATIALRQPGGKVEGRRVVIPGLPEFEPGQRYLLFLRPGYGDVGDPVVGVNQGFFSIVTDGASGREILLDAAGRTVVDVKPDRVVTRARPDGSGVSRGRLVGPPTPDAGYEEVVHGWAATSRPRGSGEAPLSPAELKRRIQLVVADEPKEVR